MQKKGQNRERSALECYNVYNNWTCLLLNRVFSQCEKCPEQNPDEIVNPTTDKKTSRTTLRPLLNSDEFGIDKDPNKNSKEKIGSYSDRTTARTTTRATTSTKTRHEPIPVSSFTSTDLFI
ncbi:uncharacterized protein LOC133531088 isoform X1 [Cydia pomonella]|uniref:uncharacterized protein LOC133531088 isoform X1 n=1 Tax=Cydia pomonella TaxID=82600 RepID=UPI002ADE7CFA|nr:uncharacterized protein LOC133531088 isoform X1 [Cydia pomonella]